MVLTWKQQGNLIVYFGRLQAKNQILCKKEENIIAPFGGLRGNLPVSQVKPRRL